MERLNEIDEDQFVNENEHLHNSYGYHVTDKEIYEIANEDSIDTYTDEEVDLWYQALVEIDNYTEYGMNEVYNKKSRSGKMLWRKMLNKAIAKLKKHAPIPRIHIVDDDEEEPKTAVEEEEEEEEEEPSKPVTRGKKKPVEDEPSKPVEEEPTIPVKRGKKAKQKEADEEVIDKPKARGQKKKTGAGVLKTKPKAYRKVFI